MLPININYSASTSFPSLNVITVAAFSGLPLLNLNAVLEVTKLSNVPFVNASTTASNSTEPASSIACFAM